MRATDFITEIEPISADSFVGGTDELGSGAVSKIPGLKPIPGMNPKFSFVVRTFRPTNNKVIDIYSKERGYLKHIAELQLETLSSKDDYPFKDAFMVATITTHEDYRGQGFASKLYELYFRYVGKILLSGRSQTPGGQRNWVSMFNSPNLTVDGLIAIPDYFFNDQNPNSIYGKYIDDIMKMGGEWVGDSRNRTHWLRVPIRHDKNRLELLYKTPRVKMYNYNDKNRSILMATWAGK
jgi:GNAT superfamily N-acetyltransferase